MEEERRRYFREIGVDMAQQRAKMLEKKAGMQRRGFATVALRDSDRTPGTATAPQPLQRGIGRSFLDKSQPGSSLLSVNPVVSEEVAIKPRKTMKQVSMAVKSALDFKNTKSDPPVVKQPRLRYVRDEFHEARRELQYRVKKLRQALLEETRTFLESDQQDMSPADYRSLSIGEGLKGSLAKMRRNLVQRRVNMAIFEKTADEWSLASISSELRRKQRSSPSAFSRQVTGATDATSADLHTNATSGDPCGSSPFPGSGNVASSGVVALPGMATNTVSGEDLLGS